MHKPNYSFKRTEYIQIILWGILVACVFVNLFVVVQHKNGLYLDEICTFILSNNKDISIKDFNEVALPEAFQNVIEKIMSSDRFGVLYRQDFINNLYVPQDQGFNLFPIYILQTIDVHPMLYYILIHAVSVITHSKDLIMIGFSINVFFSFITCVFLCLITYKLTRNNWLSLIVLAYYGFSYAFVFSTTYIRMYSMLTCLFVILFYLYQNVYINNLSISNSTICVTSIVEFLSFSTHYFSLIFIVVLWVLLCLYMRKQKDVKNKFMRSKILTLCIYFIVWPQSLFFFFNKSGVFTELLSINKILSYISAFVNLHLGGSLLLAISLFLYVGYVVYLYKTHLVHARFLAKDNLFKGIFIFSPPIIFYFVIVIISPWVEYRYVCAVMPFFSLLFVSFVWYSFDLLGLNEKFKKSILVSIVAYVSLFCAPNIKQPYFYERTDFENLIIKDNSIYPALIFSPDNSGTYFDVIYNFPHPQYIKADTSHKQQFVDHLMQDHYVLYLDKNLALNDACLMWNDKYRCEQLDYNTDFYNVYSLSLER